MTGKVKILLDLLSFGLYNSDINKNKQRKKIMADQPNYTDAMVSELVAQIQAALGTNQLESLVKASKADLQALAELAERAEFSS